MNVAMVNELGTVATVLGFGTILSIVATMLNHKGAGDRIVWLAMTMTMGLGFMLSLLLLVQVAPW